MHKLLEQLQPLLAREDVEGITTLLEAWQPRDDIWAQCVEGRIYAPSSSEAQRQRLRALRAAHRAAAAASPVAAVSAVPAIPVQRVAAAAATAARDPAALALPELEAALADGAARIAALPDRTATAAMAMLEIVRREQVHQQAWRQQQYEVELRGRRLPVGTSFPAFLASVASSFVRLGPAADDSELTALQALAPAPLGASLLAFYRTLGGVAGDLGDGGLGLRVLSPRQLLGAHADSQRAQRLAGLSLLDVARWCWGNDRPELDPGVLPAAVEQAARGTPCIGWIAEGSLEANGYLVQRADGLFQVHCWHQDDDFCAPDPAAPHAAELWALLHAVMRRLEHAAPGASVESLSELIEALDSGGA
ncbi:MAG: hypothetical protein MUC36_04135 [Planctomycetes bacterium]|nr:hypothetical protein [Planctomycetota bacterium]